MHIDTHTRCRHTELNAINRAVVLCCMLYFHSHAVLHTLQTVVSGFLVSFAHAITHDLSI